ncbi:MAG: hypothetical protein QN144_10235 [Armatimonadota bacterium]|nr:hypothetical protein [Armatimonadota bacterium]
MQRTRNEEAQALLRALFPDGLRGNALELRIKSGADVRRELYGSPEAVRADIYGEHESVWFGVCPRKPGSARGNKESVAFIPAVWVDIDNPNTDVNGLIHRMHPTAVVDSGGGYHVYWALRSPVDVLGEDQIAWAEEVMYGLSKAVSGDPAAAEVARVMGLPGTYNPGNGRSKIYDPPRLRRVLYVDPTVRYDVADLTRFRRPKTTQDLDLRVPDKIRSLILSGWTSDSGYASRSEADAAVVVAMLAAGHTEDEIFAVFETYPIGDKYREKGEDGKRYLRHTIDSARTFVSQGVVPGEIRAHNGNLQVFRPKHGWVTLCPEITVAARVVGQNPGFLLQDGRYIPATAFGTASETRRWFNEHLGIPWFGAEQDGQRLYQHLCDSAPRQIEGVSIVGWHGRRVVFPRQVVDEEGRLVETSDVVYVGATSARDLVEVGDWESLARDALDLYSRVHDERACAVIMGWFLATFAAPFLRKLEHDQFPILCVAGEAGAGKTVTVRDVWSRLTCTAYDQAASLRTWGVAAVLSSSNSVPVIIDEVRRIPDEVQALIRASYQMEWISRGTRSLSVRRFQLQAPVCVLGEAYWTDRALGDRTVTAYLPGDPASKHPDVLHRLQSMPLEAFALGAYRHIQRLDVESIWERAKRAITVAPTARRLHGLRVVAWGLLAFGMDRLVPVVGNPDDHEPAIDHTPDVLTELVRAVAELIRAGRLLEGKDYRIKGDELWIVRSTVLPAVEEYYTRIKTDLPLNRSALNIALTEDHRKHGGQGVVVHPLEKQRVGARAGVMVARISLAAVEERLGIPSELFTVVQS